MRNKLSEKEKKLNKIRKRQSYQNWIEWYDFLKTKPSIPEIIIKIYKHLDACYAFKSYTNSCYNAESIGQLFKDKNACKKCKHRLKCVLQDNGCSLV